MKVTKVCIHRLNLAMECGCSTEQEFSDAQYKTAIDEREFSACLKHQGQPGVEIIEMVLGELLEKEISIAQATPVRLHPLPNQVIEEGDSGGVVAVGENEQSVARVNRPQAVINRRPDPSAIKTIQRSPEQLKKAGAAPLHVMNGLAEMQIDEVEEDESITPHILDILDSHDPSGFTLRGSSDDEE